MNTGNINIGEILKNPALGNSTAGILAVVIAVAYWNPSLFPFAHAEHEHDIKNVQTVIDSSLAKASLRSEIKIATRSIWPLASARRDG